MWDGGSLALAPKNISFWSNTCTDFTVGAGIYTGATNIDVFFNTFESVGRWALRCTYGDYMTGSFYWNDVSGTPIEGQSDWYGGWVDPAIAACYLNVDYNNYWDEASQQAPLFSPAYPIWTGSYGWDLNSNVSPAP